MLISPVKITGTKMMTRKITLAALLLLLPLLTRAQDDNFGLWGSLELKYGLSKKIDLLGSGSVRTTGTSRIDETFAEAGIQYSFSKYLAASFAYRLADRYEDDASYYFRHRLSAAVKTSLPVNRFTFSGRLMFQRTTKTYIEDDSDLDARYVGRLKVKSYYNIPSCPLNPYIYAEIFVPVNNGSGFTSSKNRFSAGAELKINRHNSLEMEYIFQRDYLPHLTDKNIISVSYNFKF